MSATCINCGLPLVKNHHKDAGNPQFINIVGCPSGCLPCTEKRANGRHKVIATLRIWLEDEIAAATDSVRIENLSQVLGKLNQLEEARRVAYHTID